MLTGRAPALSVPDLAAFAAAGATVFCVTADAGDSAAWKVVLQWAHERLPQLQHYAHAAGITAFDLLPVSDLAMNAIQCQSLL